MIIQVNHKLKALIALIVIVFIFSACNKNVVYSKYEKLPEEGWKMEQKLSYEVEVDDANCLNDVYITVRHADAYPYSNLFVFLTTTYPNGKISVDTCELILANNKGEWQGNGAGEIWDNKIPLKKNVRFPQTGKYTFTFEQGMRSNPLPMIMDFGMVVEKVK